MPEAQPSRAVKPERKDHILMAVITLMFFVICLNGLGAARAPETFVAMGTAEGNARECMLDLGQDFDVAEVRVYLGCKENVHADVFIAENGQWAFLPEKNALENVFAWSKIAIDRRTNAIDLIFTDGTAYVGEIVCLGKDGGTITPVNASEFPELFDEQSCCVSTPTYYHQMMFDEIYHARTAYEYLHELPISETTQPPLGKTLISAGIALFGMNPFGYRIVCALFGTLMIPVMYLFVLRITKKTAYAALSGVLLATEFMHFSLSRIGAIDIIAAFFVLCMFYGVFAFLQDGDKRSLLFSGLAGGAGIATMRTACYALAGIAVIISIWMLMRWREVGITRENRGGRLLLAAQCALCFIAIPAAIYILSYIPCARVYTDKDLVENAVSNGISMYKYHSARVFGQPYSSPWYLWPVDWVPLVETYTSLGSTVSVIATFVNPFVCFAGLASVGHHIYLAAIRKDKTAGVLLVFYFAPLAPWMLTAGTAFINQYLICTLALILMLCHSIESLRLKNENRLVYAAGILSVSLFLLFYPVISGTEVSWRYIYGFLKWFPSWAF